MGGTPGGAGVGGAARGGARDTLGPTVPSAGYPNEAAAEVVLTALREWLEQHKDKVRPGSSRRARRKWAAGRMWPTPPTIAKVCRAPGSCSLRPFIRGVFLPCGQGTGRFEKGIAGRTPRHEPLL